MRASRLLSILLLLQARGRMTAAQLAAELEVSVRTIYRDVEALGAAGVPVYAEPGPGGGCRLVDGYRTRLTGLTGDEAEALFLAGAGAGGPGPAAQLGLGTVLAAAQIKVLAALPPELRGRAVRVRERFHVDAPGWFRTPEDLPHLATVADAVWEARRLDVRYRRPDRVVRRVLDPLGLVLKGSAWYLVARNRGEVRTYRVSRLETARAREVRFERPDGFDLAEYWAASAEQFERQMLRVEVTGRIRDAALPRLRHTVEPLAAHAASASAVPDPDRPGWLRITIPSEGVDVAHDQLVRLGADLEVLAPAELRARLAATAHQLAELYGGPSGAAPTGASSDGTPRRAR